WERPRLNEKYMAKVRANGSIELADGRTFSSPSRAAIEAAGVPAYDGWYAWTVTGRDGQSLNDLRLALDHSVTSPASPTGD
ncbi:MAG: hypothetical protein HW385_1602, partial [candidate division NC10 bacterium]|nr:hypothetical protein [candidate division NC10 bacterium]